MYYYQLLLLLCILETTNSFRKKKKKHLRILLLVQINNNHERTRKLMYTHINARHIDDLHLQKHNIIEMIVLVVIAPVIKKTNARRRPKTIVRVLHVCVCVCFIENENRNDDLTSKFDFLFIHLFRAI